MFVSVKRLDKQLEKNRKMARAATVELQEAGLEDFEVIARWDSEVGIDVFYLRNVKEDNIPDNWVELWECRSCPSMMALVSDAIVLTYGW